MLGLINTFYHNNRFKVHRQKAPIHFHPKDLFHSFVKTVNHGLQSVVRTGMAYKVIIKRFFTYGSILLRLISSLSTLIKNQCNCSISVYHDSFPWSIFVLKVNGFAFFRQFKLSTSIRVIVNSGKMRPQLPAGGALMTTEQDQKIFVELNEGH